MADPGETDGATAGGADPATGSITAESADSPTGSILFMCTANRIRSPFAAAVARYLITENGLPLEVSSAGLDEGGLPAMDQMVRVARNWDIDLSDHESQQVTAELIEASDLVITMTGLHVIDLAATYPDALTRLVTLREAATTSGETGAPAWNSGAIREWGAQIAQRPLDVLLGGAVDVVDPVGRPRRVHRRTAALIHDLVEQFLLPYGQAN